MVSSDSITPEPTGAGGARREFSQQLDSLQDTLLEMTSMVDSSIIEAMQALETRNIPLAEKVNNADQDINKLELKLQNQCIELIALQSPLAGDLRLIMSVSQIATELERIADHAGGIARSVLLMEDEPLVKPLVDIPIQAEKARAMLNKAMKAFVERDVEASYSVDKDDDEVDALYDHIYRDLIDVMVSDPSVLEPATWLLWVAHNLERIADRSTNIAERTIFTATGELSPDMSSSSY